MKKLKLKLIIYAVVTVAFIIVIFLLSAQPRSVSSANSLKILTNIFEFFKLPNAVKSAVKLHNFFRKTAHFTAYMILAMLSYNMFRLWFDSRKRAAVGAVIFCVVLASFDEIHQIFVPGRSAEVRDVLIDTLGACLGLALVWVVDIISRKCKTLYIKNKRIK